MAYESDGHQGVMRLKRVDKATARICRAVLGRGIDLGGLYSSDEDDKKTCTMPLAMGFGMTPDDTPAPPLEWRWDVCRRLDTAPSCPCIRMENIKRQGEGLRY